MFIVENLSLEMERFRQEHGHRSVAGLKKKHVEALMEAKRETPAAANKLKKLIGRLCRYAINDFGYAMTDPTQGVKPYKMKCRWLPYMDRCRNRSIPGPPR